MTHEMIINVSMVSNIGGTFELYIDLVLIMFFKYMRNEEKTESFIFSTRCLPCDKQV